MGFDYFLLLSMFQDHIEKLKGMLASKSSGSKTRFRGRMRKVAGHHSSVLVLDIGTETVKALACDVDHDKGKVEVLGVGRVRQRLGDMRSGGVIDMENVAENVQAAMEEAEANAGMETEQVIVGIAGELVKGTTLTIEYFREDPTQTMSLQELRHVVHKVQWKAYEMARRELSDEIGYNEVEIKLVHTAIVDVRIDGYTVSNPIGFTGKNVQMSIFNAFAPLVHYQSIVDIARGVGKELLSVVVEPFAVSKARDMEDGGDVSAIYVDIGGGTTDVALIVNGGIVGTKMFALGGRVFTKRLAKHFHIPFAEAEKLKLEYSKKKLRGEKREKIQELIVADVETWLEGLHFTLSAYEQKEFFPTRMYISGGGSLLPELKKALEKKNWYKGLRFVKRPQVAYVEPEHMGAVEDKTKKLDSPQDITPLGLAHMALELAGEDRILTKVLKQVTRVIAS